MVVAWAGGSCHVEEELNGCPSSFDLLHHLLYGMGVGHVIWGTDSVWYGSPQWQIEAFRRLEIPEDLQKKHGFAPLGKADGAVKAAILGGNSA